MSNTSNELPVLNTSEWLQPETFEKILRTVPAILASLSKLKKMLPKRGGSKRDPRTLAADIDELRKDLVTVCGLMTKATEINTKFVEAVAGLVSKGGALPRLVTVVFGSAGNLNKVINIVLAHETRLEALEASIATGKKKRVSGKTSLSLTGAKAQKKERPKKAKAN